MCCILTDPQIPTGQLMNCCETWMDCVKIYTFPPMMAVTCTHTPRAERDGLPRLVLGQPRFCFKHLQFHLFLILFFSYLLFLLFSFSLFSFSPPSFSWDKILPCSPGWLRFCNLPAFTFQVLSLKVCTATLNFPIVLMSPCMTGSSLTVVCVLKLVCDK